VRREKSAFFPIDRHSAITGRQGRQRHKQKSRVSPRRIASPKAQTGKKRFQSLFIRIGMLCFCFLFVFGESAQRSWQGHAKQGDNLFLNHAFPGFPLNRYYDVRRHYDDAAAAARCWHRRTMLPEKERAECFGPLPKIDNGNGIGKRLLGQFGKGSPAANAQARLLLVASWRSWRRTTYLKLISRLRILAAHARSRLPDDRFGFRRWVSPQCMAPSGTNHQRGGWAAPDLCAALRRSKTG